MAKSKVSGKKFHFTGNQEDGSAVFVECDKAKPSDELLVVTAEKLEPGVPVRAGSRIANFQPMSDGHVTVTDLLDEVESSRGGPPKVATTAFRSGWDRTFGAKGVN